MITGTDKTISLRVWLNEQGIDLRADGTYHPAHLSEEYVQNLVNSYSIQQARSWWSAQVDLIAKQKRDSIVSGYSAGEMASWSIKELEAGKYTSEETSADTCPLLYAEAAARGVSVATIRTRVLANASAFRSAEAAIAGKAGKLRDLISEAGFQDMPDITIGWPV